MKYRNYPFLLLLLLFACGAEHKEKNSEGSHGETIPASMQQGNFPYQLHAPDETYTLPGSLLELSGMQSLEENLIACVQDEKGIIYLFDRSQKKVVREIEWGEKGDYEGISGNKQTLYILRSDGTIFSVSDYNTAAAAVVQQWKTGVDKACDAEGLFFQQQNGRLLMACKGGGQGVRNIWAFDLQQQVLSNRPFLQISQKTLEDVVVTDGLDRFSLAVKKIFDVAGESGILAPSGIAVHPQSGDLYILSANSKLLMVFSSTGELLFVEELPSSLFTHPESITFTEEGNLLIGNEGKGTAPTILFFKHDKEI